MATKQEKLKQVLTTMAENIDELFARVAALEKAVGTRPISELDFEDDPIKQELIGDFWDTEYCDD